ncbi:MAG TPA: hypothetical protein VF950_00945 [Planctomycetota bacterium]
MAKTGGVLAILATLALSMLLVLRLRQERYSGHAYDVTGEVCTFYVDHPPLMGYFPSLPPTFPAELGGFSIVGTKGDSETVFRLRFPSDLRVHAVPDARVEIRHEVLDLPFTGSFVGSTTVKIGSGKWRHHFWPLWGTIAGIAAVPGLMWLLIAIPIALLERRRSL